MPNHYALLAAVLAIVGAFGYGYYTGRSHANTACEARTQTAVAQAQKEVIETERVQHDQVSAALATQYWEQRSIAGRLAAELERLRVRPSRASLPSGARPACAGTTGAELSREDADFLARESARADTLRSALGGCYAYVDAVARRRDAE